MMHVILRSLNKWLDSIANINAYIYYDSLLDISETYQCTSKTNVVVGETSFIVVDTSTGNDLKSLENTLENRYISIVNSATFESEIIKITNYISATGEITLASGLDFELTTSTSFDIIFYDTIFIDSAMSFETNTKIYNVVRVIPIYLHLHTKNDSNQSKISSYSYLIEEDFIKKKKLLSIYNPDDDAVCGYMKCNGNISIQSDRNDKEQLQKYILNFDIQYTTDYSKT